MIDSMDAAIHTIFKTRRRLDGAPRGLDEYTRDVSWTRKLLERADLFDEKRAYAVVTGSRGKGSVTTIMAKLLESLGHRVGALTSPHLVHWNERIRVDGRMIPTSDFLRILRELQPMLDSVTEELSASQYLSPQGIFLAIALRHFNEMNANVAVLEVGRGGRFDDVAVAPNRLAVFAPIMREHSALLGEGLERIAWHKAGIIKRGCDVVTLPQDPAAMSALKAEADVMRANLTCLQEADLAKLLADRPAGQLIHLPPYGQLFIPLLGRYQLENATLAIRAVERFQRRLGGAMPESVEFMEAIQSGLKRVKWLGRAQKLDDTPATFVDGAITVASAQSFVESLQDRLSEPVISIVGTPADRDFPGVYRQMADVSQALIITETDINPNTRFPAQADAVAAARECCADVSYRKALPGALALARAKAGESGTILLAVSLMLVGECMLIWDVDTSAI
ncbi:MAG: Mur ligase family protein [Chloroflexi bacterium]|nr:Mur ligase family protein [Chloroflexota bacterium]